MPFCGATLSNHARSAAPTFHNKRMSRAAALALGAALSAGNLAACSDEETTDKVPVNADAGGDTVDAGGDTVDAGQGDIKGDDGIESGQATAA